MASNLSTFWYEKEQRVVATAFLSLAVVFGAWITRLPALQQKLSISDGQLGTALFFLPIGAVTLLPFYSKIIHRLSERNTILFGLFLLFVGLLLTTQSPALDHLMAALYIAGLGIGLMDVSMNAVAAEIEKQRKVQIMSACHGFFSIGGVIGAFWSMLCQKLSIDVFPALIALTLVFGIAMLLQRKSLLNSNAPRLQTGLSLPPKSIIGLALVGIFIMMAEGGVTDWSTVYIERAFEIKGYLAGMGFAGFSLMMALGRFFGDALILKHSGLKLMRLGILTGILGLLLIQLPNVLFAIVGFSLAGLGLSLVVPIIFGRAAKTPGVSSAKGLASVASAGYIGWLIGPVSIGYISEWQGLSFSFASITILCTLALVITYKLD